MLTGAHYNSASLLDGLPLTHNKKNSYTWGNHTSKRLLTLFSSNASNMKAANDEESP